MIYMITIPWRDLLITIKQEFVHHLLDVAFSVKFKLFYISQEITKRLTISSVILELITKKVFTTNRNYKPIYLEKFTNCI